MKRLDRIFEPCKDYGAVFLRIILGWRLIYGTQDNILSWAQMLEFRDFLDAHGVPFPLLAAHVSVYVQFVCGLLLVAGAWVRYAALILTVNFTVALLLVHTNDTFLGAFDALVILFGSLFFLFNGAGRLSFDQRRLRSN